MILTISSSTRLVFMDRTVENTEKVLEDIGKNTEVIYLDPKLDGVKQIADILQNVAITCPASIRVLYIVSKLEPGILQLGNSKISVDTIDRYGEDLRQWADALAPGAGIALWGCDSISGEQGQILAQRLFELTGARVCPRGAGTTRYWVGKGRNCYWSNRENWSEETLPTAFDTVIFDGNCPKNAILDICPQMQNLTITADYTGILSGWNDINVEQSALIQNGEINVNLEVGKNLTIEGGFINSYLSVGGDLIVKGGKLAWFGGVVKGNTILEKGSIYFASEYNSYYIFEGNFTRSDTSLEGTPIFIFKGAKPQIFNLGTETIKLRDLYNKSQLTLKGKLNIESFFFNAGSLTVEVGSILDTQRVKCFTNKGILIEKGQIIEGKQSEILLLMEAENISQSKHLEADINQEKPISHTQNLPALAG